MLYTTIYNNNQLTLPKPTMQNLCLNLCKHSSPSRHLLCICQKSHSCVGHAAIWRQNYFYKCATTCSAHFGIAAGNNDYAVTLGNADTRLGGGEPADTWTAVEFAGLHADVSTAVRVDK